MLWWRSLWIITFILCLESSESVRWPAGTYGIPKPASGCPSAEGFQWDDGWRSQGPSSNNDKSAEFHLDAVVERKKVKRSFCSKTSTTGDHNRANWPPGQYCIYKKGPCPPGLKSGYVYWDDYLIGNNNGKGGTLPDGTYNSDTLIYFCCRTDGHKDNPIVLPSKSPFFLLAYRSAKCQMVKWAVATVEWIYYDTTKILNDGKAVDAYPYEAGKKRPTIYYCFYRGCNETLSTSSGTFQSPNYPSKYPDGQYCSWRITVNTTQQIRLIFTNFLLQNESNTDALYVYDGENSTGEVLGVFYGGRPPPKEGIYSLSNQLFLIFKSDHTDSYSGFSASYFAFQKSEPSVTTTQTTDMTISPSLESTTLTTEPASTIHGPNKEGGEKDEREQHQEKAGFNAVAVVVPVVLVIFLVAGLIPVFFYCKRKRKSDAKPDKVMFSARSSDELPISLGNPYYDRNLVVANSNQTAEGSELMYTDVKETEKLNKMESYNDQENENPLYEGADDALLNPSDLVMGSTQACEGNELYTDVEEPGKYNVKEQESDNPLYEAADHKDPVFNPIYDSPI